MSSLVMNNSWRTVLPTRIAEGCFRGVSGQEQEEVGRAGAEAEILLWAAMLLNVQQLIFQGKWVKYFLKNFFCLLFCWGNDEG